MSGFVSDVQLREENVRFDSLSESETAEDLTAGGGAHLMTPSPIQVVIMGINGGDADSPKLDDLVLSEMCQMESVSWGLCGKQVSVSWVIRDLEPLVRHTSPSPYPSREDAPIRLHSQHWHRSKHKRLGLILFMLLTFRAASPGAV